jgi:hypothetical protein
MLSNAARVSIVDSVLVVVVVDEGNPGWFALAECSESLLGNGEILCLDWFFDFGWAPQIAHGLIAKCHGGPSL